MIILSKVTDYFFEAVKMSVTCDPALRDMILKTQNVETRNPRIVQFLNNLTKEVEGAQDAHQKKFGKYLKETTIKGFIYDFTEIFLKGMESEAKLRYESDLEKSARDAAAQEIQDFENTLSGNASGIFEEAGIITNEKIDAERSEVLKEK